MPTAANTKSIFDFFADKPENSDISAEQLKTLVEHLQTQQRSDTLAQSMQLIVAGLSEHMDSSQADKQPAARMPENARERALVECLRCTAALYDPTIINNTELQDQALNKAMIASSKALTACEADNKPWARVKAGIGGCLFVIGALASLSLVGAIVGLPLMYAGGKLLDSASKSFSYEDKAETFNSKITNLQTEFRQQQQPKQEPTSGQSNPTPRDNTSPADTSPVIDVVRPRGGGRKNN